jgi:hypothetical protein
VNEVESSLERGLLGNKSQVVLREIWVFIQVLERSEWSKNKFNQDSAEVRDTRGE